ncbi:MAG: PrsW family intramembrane metalloprotease [Bacteroidales bacterium]|nr:PrsW family intramembrane metalloprotease [Bacteroidales bacterium]
MKIVIIILPIILLLIFLFLLGSFKLVLKKYLIFSIIWGMLCAIMCYFINTHIGNKADLEYETLSRYIFPAIEEIFKSIFILFLISKKRIWFMVDAAIYGFAIGTGFSLIENIFYLQTFEGTILTWIIRCFGTAIMHGGCTALFSVIIIGTKNQKKNIFLPIIFSIVIVYIIHSTFNHLYINTMVQTLAIITVLPIVFILLFKNYENQLHNWMGIELNSEFELLRMIKDRDFFSSRPGKYLASFKSRFSDETITDLYRYLEIYLELSTKAKRNIMLIESGFPIIHEEDIKNKLKNLKELHRKIGAVGIITLTPLIRMKYRDLWKFNLLKF